MYQLLFFPSGALNGRNQVRKTDHNDLQIGSKNGLPKEEPFGDSSCLWDRRMYCLTFLSLDREEMKSLQAALQKQLDEANERAEKQQATVRQSRPDRQHPVVSNQHRHLSHRPQSDPVLLDSRQLFLASPLNWNSQKWQERALCPLQPTPTQPSHYNFDNTSLSIRLFNHLSIQHPLFCLSVYAAKCHPAFN